MDELCVHCGNPIQYVRYSSDWDGSGWVHRHGIWAQAGAHRMCPDGTGHMACPTQAGIE